MNAQTITVTPSCRRFATFAPGGCRPFAKRDDVRTFFEGLRGDLPTARSIAQNLRFRARSVPELVTWLFALLERIADAVRPARSERYHRLLREHEARAYAIGCRGARRSRRLFQAAPCANRAQE